MLAEGFSVHTLISGHCFTLTDLNRYSDGQETLRLYLFIYLKGPGQKKNIHNFKCN